MNDQVELLKSIDAKLTGILALLARQLPDDSIKGLEALLRQAGLTTKEIAGILGKSQRAVQVALKAQGFKE
jgi:DNA-binding CsgD family transcriptional regulator